MFQDAIIAPLWNDWNLAESAKLYYRVSKNQSDLDFIANLIANATSESGYQPTLAIIVTWENVTESNDRINFQRVSGIVQYLAKQKWFHVLGSGSFCLYTIAHLPSHYCN